MLQARIAAIVAVAGAIGLQVVAVAPIEMFMYVADFDPNSGFPGLMMMGAFCAALFSIGLCGVAYAVINPSVLGRGALVGAALALVIGLLGIGYGNTRVAMAFRHLAMAEQVVIGINPVAQAA